MNKPMTIEQALAYLDANGTISDKQISAAIRALQEEHAADRTVIDDLIYDLRGRLARSTEQVADKCRTIERLELKIGGGQP